MNMSTDFSALTPQRWEGPLDFPPGYFKRQLPNRYVDIAGRGDTAALQIMLAEHPEFLNKRSGHRRTLLWEAVRQGRFATVQWLVEQGANIDATGCHNGESYIQLTPYCAAVYYRRSKIAEYLHSQGTHLDIFRAAFMGNQAQVMRELDAQPELLNAEDPQDDLYLVPLLAFAVVGGHIHLLDALLQRGAVVAPYSAQLLSLAARDSRRDMVDLLVAHGAEIRAMDPGTFVLVSDMSLFQYLLDQGVTVATPGKNRMPPLVYLSRGDKGEHPEKIEMLLNYKAPVNGRARNGRTALHYAATAGFLKVMTLLLNHGADVTLRDEKGDTALALARAANKDAAADRLIQHGAKR